jgi:hypothetical protein
MAEASAAGKINAGSDEVLAKSTDLPQASKLIGSVSVQPTTVKPGESVLVQVLDASGKPYAADSPVVVTVNGVPATRRYLQFVGAGTYTLQVRAVSGSSSDMATATVTVAGDPLTFRRTLAAPEVRLIPKLLLAQTFANHYQATFTLGVALPAVAAAKTAAPAEAAAVKATVAPTAATELAAAAKDLTGPAAVAPSAQTAEKAPVKSIGKAESAKPSDQKETPQATSYKWSFGDGTTATTQAPTVTHDYFPAIRAGTLSHAFDVTCTVAHDNITVTRTLVLNSAYELCKRFGTIVPHVESDVFATWRKKVGFSASMTVYNIEAEPITLEAMGFVPLSDNPDALLPAPVFTTMKTPITIKPKSASALGVLISISQLALATKLGNAVPGFMVYYRGSYTEGGKKTPVLFSRTVRIPLNISGGAWLTEASTAPKQGSIPWDAVKSAAFAVANDPSLKVASDASAIVSDEATQTFAIALDKLPQSVAAKAQASAAIRSGIAAGLAGIGA